MEFFRIFVRLVYRTVTESVGRMVGLKHGVGVDIDGDATSEE